MNEMKNYNYEIEDISPIPFAHKKVIYNKNGNITGFRFIHINPALEKILGMKNGDIKGQSDFEILELTKTQYRMRLESLSEKRKTNNTAVIEQYSKMYDKWFRCKLRFQDDETVLIWLEDIDNQIYYENELIQSEELYESVFDNIVDAIYIQKVDDDEISSNFFKVNQAACDVLGYTENELLKLSPKAITPERLLYKFPVIIEELLGNGYVRFRSENITKEGRIIPVEVVSHFFPYKEQNMIATIVTDLSSKIEAEKKEKENRKLLQSVLDTLPGRLFVISTDFKILACNKHFEDISDGNRQFEDFAGETCYKALSNGHEICRDCNLKKVIENPKSFSVIKEYQENGEYKCVKRYFAPIINTEGNVSGIIEYIEDITELKLIQRKAEEANLAKSTFMMNMSHELRTPLNGILGFSGILEDMIHDEEQSEHIRNIKTSGYHLLALINDLLDFSEMESKTLALKNEEMNLHHLLDLCMTLIQMEAYKKGLETEFIYDESIPETVFTDRLRLSQIINNLLANAVKFTEKGKIRLKAENIGFTHENVRVCFSVCDTGIGIKESLKDVIFDSFTQGDSSITRKYGGTGLGLTLSRQLLSFLGSKMEVESKENEGSTFSFVLEMDYIRKTIPVEDAITPEEENYRHNFKVLIVEDNLINMKLVQVILEKHYRDVEIYLANNGQDAIKQYLLIKPDVIFMDIRMPVMNGIEATRMIRKYDSGGTRIIGLSAEVRPNEINLGIEGGMDGYLSKPVKENAIVAEVSRVLKS